MATFELDLAERWLYSRLGDDPILQGIWIDRLYNGAPPQGVERPIGLFTVQSAVDDLSGQGVRSAARVQYLVRVIFDGENLLDGAVAASRIDALLDNTIGAVPGGRILSARRQGAFSLVEFPQGKRVNHRGGFYEFLVQPA